jgi:hypothetical protein
MRSTDSLRVIAPPSDALRRLSECLVLSFRHDRPQRQFVLITDYPDRAVGSDRAFLATIFSGVDRFVREAPTSGQRGGAPESYEARDGTPPVVMQAVTCGEAGGRAEFEGWLGPSFGGWQFRYEAVVAVVRDVLVRRAGESFHYHDIATQAELDFYRPFEGYEWDPV